jgi:hypothetical protein
MTPLPGTFPQPDKNPVLAPYEIFYDTYYHYAPRVQRNFSCNYISDSYGNFTQSETADAVYSQLSHLSDAGFPQTVPGSNGYFLTKYYEQISPEQGKYTTSLDISYTDVTRLDEVVPAVRTPGAADVRGITMLAAAGRRLHLRRVQ